MGMFVGENGGDDGFSTHSMPSETRPSIARRLIDGQKELIDTMDSHIETLEAENKKLKQLVLDISHTCRIHTAGKYCSVCMNTGCYRRPQTKTT